MVFTRRSSSDGHLCNIFVFDRVIRRAQVVTLVNFLHFVAICRGWGSAVYVWRRIPHLTIVSEGWMTHGSQICFACPSSGNVFSCCHAGLGPASCSHTSHGDHGITPRPPPSTKVGYRPQSYCSGRLSVCATFVACMPGPSIRRTPSCKASFGATAPRSSERPENGSLV